jgi:hypothetical protein
MDKKHINMPSKILENMFSCPANKAVTNPKITENPTILCNNRL